MNTFEEDLRATLRKQENALDGHTLARLGAARRAREHRRVNAVLAGAPLAALWGPNPVPRWLCSCRC